MKNKVTQLAKSIRIILQRIIRLCNLPFEIADTLKQIQKHLSVIEANANKVGACVNDDNHQRRSCVITGHWNQPGSRW